MTFRTFLPQIFVGSNNPPSHSHPINNNILNLNPIIRALALTLACISTAHAGESPAETVPVVLKAKAPKPLFDDLGLIYKNNDNRIINEFWFLGRYHGQYHWSNGSNGNSDFYETRRARIGAQVRLFKHLSLHAQMISGPDFEPLYNGFTELWAAWQFNEALILTLGQQKHRFTHDRNVSSRYLNYLERGELTNMFNADYTPAVTLSGRIGKWNYYTGIFSNATGTDMGKAFTDFDSGYSLLASATVDLADYAEQFHTDSALLNFCYLYSDANVNATNLNRFNDGLSTALILTKDSASLITEVTAGLGAEAGNAVGLNLQPGLFLTDKLQIVGRYQLAGSDGQNGLQAQRRYERFVGMQTGDRYQAVCLGLNYYVLGHRLKIMGGVEYATIGGRDAWTSYIAVRTFWGPHARGPFPTNTTLPGIIQ